MSWLRKACLALFAGTLALSAASAEVLTGTAVVTRDNDTAGLAPHLAIDGDAARALFETLTGADVLITYGESVASDGSPLQVVTRSGAGIACSALSSETVATFHRCALTIRANGVTKPGDTDPIAGVGG